MLRAIPCLRHIKKAKAAVAAGKTDLDLLDPDAKSSDNAYSSFQGLLALALARITSSASNETRGACRKCGRVGHLTFQCRNFLSIKDKDQSADPSAAALDAPPHNSHRTSAQSPSAPTVAPLSVDC